MKVSKINGHGNHLLLECYGGDFKKLGDKNLIKKFLEEFPSKIGMNRISEVLVVRYDAEDEEESGFSGVVLLAESHISIHTYPNKKFAVADVFSCKEFDVEDSVNFIKNKFLFNKINSRLVVREYEES